MSISATIPSAVRPGDPVRIIAPSGAFDRTVFGRGLAHVAQRYSIRMQEGVYSRHSFFAGDDERRLAELNEALRDPEAKAILVARGGHGLLRISHEADFAPLKSHPKWLVGFSDATLLHIECARLGVASIHAANITGLGIPDDTAWQHYHSHLESPTLRREYPTTSWHPGTARGPLFGGNLAVLHASLASGRLSLPRGCILLLEDIGESPYRIDRLLTAMLIARVFDNVAAVVVGQLHNCPPGDHGVTAEAVLQERLVQLQIPVVHTTVIGHGQPNLPITLGLTAQITDSGALHVG
ncbi:MAG TPA: LD-carboxypeptidase [Polyangiaceae bacterium]|nr:LD-carboxypeptidase [Polyangiaceae bacterium]